MIEFTNAELTAILTTMQLRIDKYKDLIEDARNGEYDINYNDYRAMVEYRKLLMRVYFKTHDELFKNGGH